MIFFTLILQINSSSNPNATLHFQFTSTTNMYPTITMASQKAEVIKLANTMLYINTTFSTEIN